MSNKAVYTSPSTMQFVLEYFTTQEIYNKAVNTCFFVFDSVCDQYKM